MELFTANQMFRAFLRCNKYSKFFQATVSPNTLTISRMISHTSENRVKSKWDTITPSYRAQTIRSPMRDDPMPPANPNPGKKSIKLHLGDPSLGVLKPPESALTALKNLPSNDVYNSIHENYGHTKGIEEIRGLLADKLSEQWGQPVHLNDVILTNGCQHALQLATFSLCDAGTNVLVPMPGYPVESVFLKPDKIEARCYQLNLNREGNHTINLDHVESLIDKNTSAFVLNNPSNPTGAVYSKAHLQDLCKLLEERRVPVISDELYGSLVFGDGQFHSLANIQPRIPTLICDGASKRYLVPGWRIGWIVLRDRDGALGPLWEKLGSMAHYINGPCRLAQATLGTLLKETPSSYFDDLNVHLAKSSEIICNELVNCNGLTIVKPQGGTSCLILVNENFFGGKETTAESFVVKLIEQESVYVHPGAPLNCPMGVRMNLCHDHDSLREACKRMKEFCTRNYVS